ncbi:MAG: peptidoglycan editing factor PgeF [Clostridiales bacterium]|nr:peptidoglycan editing factor PgeF [Clostridiales bacterium]
MQIYGQNVQYIKSKLLSKYDSIISHGITIRGTDFMHKDISSSIFLSSKEKMAKEFDLSTNDLYFLNQVHDKNVLEIFEDTTNEIKDYDALVTKAPNKMLMTCFADCVPILLFDVQNKIVASIHSGWKGTVKQVAKNTVEYMQEKYNSNPQNIIAVIGPSIGPCCFEVKDDVKKQFVDAFGNSVAVDNKVDLWMANKLQLINCGLKEANIECVNICTCCNNDMFYSYRKGDVEQGRFSAFIMLK